MRMMSWKHNRLKRELFARVPEIPQEKLVLNLGVDEDHPVLLSVMHVLKGLEEMAIDSLRSHKLSADERSYHAGAIAWLADAQETILRLAQTGRERRRNQT